MIITENMSKSSMKNGNVTHWHLGSLASPGDREESASHRVLIRNTYKNIKHCAPVQNFGSGVVSLGEER